MDIKDDAFYSVKETSKIVNISKRTLQRIAKKEQNRIIDGRYLFTGFQIKELLTLATKQTPTSRQTTETPPNDIQGIIKEIDNDDYVLSVLKAIKENKHLEEFSDEELQQFNDRLKEATYLENRIAEYKKEIERMEDYVLDYRNNIEYLKKSLDKRADETAILLKSIEQRNYIEAKEKKLG
jgi:phenylpyruvate tautomerase PptA (4-oxalocrotonate tautomerase family)